MIKLAAKYTDPEFAMLIERETDHLELKTGTSRLQEAFVAFSNGNGGAILIGVTDSRQVVGRLLDQGTDDKIHEAALAARDVGRYRVLQISIGNKKVIGIEVHRREEGFAQTSDGRILVRRGGRSVALFGQDAWEFISGRVLRRFERADSGVAFAEHVPDLLDALCKAHSWRTDTPDLLDRLAERGLVTGTNLTIAGALFLTRPLKALNLKKAVIEVRRYATDGPDYDRRLEFAGSLPEQISEATRFVVGELGSDLIVTGLYRHELPRLPEVVVREAIANAVAHRSYETNRTCVLVELRPDEVIVRSPGSLPVPVTVATIRQAQAARNPDVIDILRRFSLAEDAGRGVDVMEDSMEEALLDPPRFSDDGGNVTVVLPLRGPITGRERAWISELERAGTIEAGDRLLLVHAARGEVLTNAVARTILGTEDSGRGRMALQRLRDAGLLEQRGDRGGASYVLTEDIAPPAAFRLTPRQLADLVVDAAAAQFVSNEDVRQLTGLDRPGALSLLRQLVRAGLLTRVGEKRGTRYIAK